MGIFVDVIAVIGAVLIIAGVLIGFVLYVVSQMDEMP